MSIWQNAYARLDPGPNHVYRHPSYVCNPQVRMVTSQFILTVADGYE